MLIQAAAPNILNASVLIFPALECFHIIGFALLIAIVHAVRKLVTGG